MLSAVVSRRLAASAASSAFRGPAVQPAAARLFSQAVQTDEPAEQALEEIPEAAAPPSKRSLRRAASICTSHPRGLLNRLEALEVRSKPTLMENGVWRKPLDSKRTIARLRRMVYLGKLNGVELDWPLPEKQRTPMRGIARPPKLHKDEHTKQARIDTLKKNLLRMDKVIEEYRLERVERREKKRPIV
ncbi:hypothetical protein H696_02925 [Fonticula alba]|uniref:MRPL25 domain-containing protein n=1 Tax=Fonticula alba TaxID=691883 RepID=A0A058Z8K7_FONAL|nr:hypothetical protein H696_02925 [Fonticula alba]KCV70580.1 hypothetical protein H696_02925 [Fonticula alba]|eukprot:XP_009495096.1 hypothetical protein H696_02925 [Fonticula alba]